MKGKIESLPKWARQEIERLERDVEHFKAKLAAGPEDSDTFADTYTAAPRPLGKGPSIDFRFGPGWDEKFQARLEGRSLIVNGGNSIAVFPQASNVVHIRVTR